MTDSIGREFMRKTAYKFLGESLQKQGVPQPPLELDYPLDAQLIPLPDPLTVTIPALDLRAAILQRRTLRRYAETPLSQDELSFLLWCTQGIKEVTKRPVTFRTVPSAGARHAFETYLLINRVEGIAPGLYRYIATEHALLPVLQQPELAQRAVEACLDQDTLANSAVSFFWVAVLARMYWRYGERGYRYLHLDAGHVCQNLYLAAEAAGCGVCAIAAYDDDKVNQLLGADGEELFAVYMATVGKKMEEC